MMLFLSRAIYEKSTEGQQNIPVCFLCVHNSYVRNENNNRIVMAQISNWINTNILFMSFLSLRLYQPPPPLILFLHLALMYVHIRRYVLFIYSRRCFVIILFSIEFDSTHCTQYMQMLYLPWNCYAPLSLFHSSVCCSFVGVFFFCVSFRDIYVIRFWNCSTERRALINPRETRFGIYDMKHEMT